MRTSALTALTLSLASCGVLAQARVTAVAATSIVEKIVLPTTKTVGYVDWTKGKLLVTSYGAPKEGETHPGVKKATARKAAFAEAWGEAAAVVLGVRVSSEIITKDVRLLDSATWARIEGYLKGAVPVKEEWDEKDELFAVTLALNLAGPADSSILGAMKMAGLLGLEKKLEDQARPAPIIPEEPVATPEPAPTRKPGPYTGLIVDLRGYGAMPCMSPKLKRPDGTEVWGTTKIVGRDYALAKGIAGWLPTLELALKHDRAGANPLMVRAIGVQGAYRGNAVLSDEDAELILKANQESKNHFLDNCRVIFVIESPYKERDLKAAGL